MKTTVKTLTVDWDSLKEMERLFNQIKARVCDLRKTENGGDSRKRHYNRVFDHCQHIWNTDISPVYAGTAFDEEKKFYVYAHLDTSRKIAPGKHPITTFAAFLGMSHFPFYVGKGAGNRLENTDRNETHRKICQKLRMLGREPLICKIKDSLTESDALQYEAKLIDIFGLLPHGGLLTNLDEGYRAQERRGFYLDQFSSLRKFNSEVLVPSLGNNRSHVVVAS